MVILVSGNCIIDHHALTQVVSLAKMIMRNLSTAKWQITNRRSPTTASSSTLSTALVGSIYHLKVALIKRANYTPAHVMKLLQSVLFCAIHFNLKSFMKHNTYYYDLCSARIYLLWSRSLTEKGGRGQGWKEVRAQFKFNCYSSVSVLLLFTFYGSSLALWMPLGRQ